MSTMKAFVYQGDGVIAVCDKKKPVLLAQTDAVIKVLKTTICGTDLHIKRGDVATCKAGTTLGHEGVGLIDEIGSSVSEFRKGDTVLISCISSCSQCNYCRLSLRSHCATGGWLLGHKIDGTQAEYVRVPHADSSLYHIDSIDRRAYSKYVMISDIFPTAFECGVEVGKVKPGSSVVIVGAGPVGLAALTIAQLYAPNIVIMVDIDEKRLSIAEEMGATHVINSSQGGVVKFILDLTDNQGCDTVIEAVGLPDTFELCQDLIAPGGVIANIGVHGKKADLHLESLWGRNITITTRLVDTVSTPMLLKLVKSGRLDPSKMITHNFKFWDIENAYEIFENASQNGALKVIIEM